MGLRTQDIVPISEARARLTELAEEVVGGNEKVLTKGGASFIALVDARKLDYYHDLEAAYRNLVLLDAMERGLESITAKAVLDTAQLMALLEAI